MGTDERVCKICPNHGMEEWLILYLFYNALNPISKSMLEIASTGIFMGRQVDVATKLLNDIYAE
jgi:hypothetical protein